jgi:hypothetical protein
LKETLEYILNNYGEILSVVNEMKRITLEEISEGAKGGSKYLCGKGEPPVNSAVFIKATTKKNLDKMKEYKESENTSLTSPRVDVTRSKL